MPVEIDLEFDGEQGKRLRELLEGFKELDAGTREADVLQMIFASGVAANDGRRMPRIEPGKPVSTTSRKLPVVDIVSLEKLEKAWQLPRHQVLRFVVQDGLTETEIKLITRQHGFGAGRGQA